MIDFCNLAGGNNLRYKRTISIFLVMMVLFSAAGCSKKGNVKEKISIYIESKDANTLNVMKFLIDGFKKENKGISVSINNVLDDSDIMTQISKDKKVDVILTSRENMTELAQKGMLLDMNSIAEKVNLNKNYNEAVTGLGFVNSKLSGVGFMPYSFEIFYNITALNKLGLNVPQNANDIQKVFKTLKQKSISIPVIVPGDIDIYNGLSTYIASNTVNNMDIESAYGKSMNDYLNIKSMQNIFDSISLFVKNGMLDKNTFIKGDNDSVKSLANGNIPVGIFSSYYLNVVNKSTSVDTFDNFKEIFGKTNNVPVFLNNFLCISSTYKDTQETSDFFKYIFSEKAEKNLLKAGYITGRKLDESSLSELQKKVYRHISQSTQSNAAYICFLPQKSYKIINNKIIEIIGGKSSQDAWKNIISSVYGK